MEDDIQAGKFIEYGEYKGNLYGTSAEGVSSLVNAGYVCLLNPHYQALKMLRTAQSKPYIIYVKPPRFDILKETRNEARARSTFDETNSRGFTASLVTFFVKFSRLVGRNGLVFNKNRNPNGFSFENVHTYAYNFSALHIQ